MIENFDFEKLAIKSLRADIARLKRELDKKKSQLKELLKKERKK